MNADRIPQAIFLLLLLVVVGSSLAVRRLPLRQTAKMALAWVGIFAVVLGLVVFRGDFQVLGSRLAGAITGEEGNAAVVVNGEMRIPMSADGHFWVQADVNGVPVKFLVDSGASLTTIGRDVAEQAGVEPGIRVAEVETANGSVVMRRAEARLVAGPIAREEFPILIADQPGLNVLGMNFLSSLGSWRAEGRVLVLQP